MGRPFAPRKRAPVCGGSKRYRGFTYLLLLFMLAVGAAGLAAIAEQAGTAARREREAELIFRGQAIAQALNAYVAAMPGPGQHLPTTLQELVEDRRGPRVLHHLRRLYVDPFTGKADWVLIKTDDGHITGVHSRAALPALRTFDLPLPAQGQRALISDREFSADAASPNPAQAPAPSTGNTPRR